MGRAIRKYPRYTPSPQRPPGTGAFFDFASAVMNRHAEKLKSCSLVRRWGKAAPEPEAVPVTSEF